MMGVGSVRQRLRRIVFAGFVPVLLACLCGCGRNGTSPVPARPDVVAIDSLAAFGELERGPVTFLHDRHVEALRRQNVDCTACHLRDDQGTLSQKFQRLTDGDRQELRDLYHTRCLGCHQERADKGQAAPVTCDGCHPRQAVAAPARQPAGFDLVLHARHIQAEAGRCDPCHHVFDERQKTLLYVKGEESSCRDCHREQAEGDSPSFRFVAHQACIGCHQEPARQGQGRTLPVLCGGCHALADGKTAEKPARVPRLEVGQPDLVLLRTAAADLSASTMNTVPFDHRRHEAATPTCRACHHESLKACMECHLLQGGDRGGNVTLERAMHSVESNHSCVGCHEEQKARKECAGCHALMEKGRLSDTACRRCHYGPLPAEAGTPGASAPPPAAGGQTFTAAEIPEVVNIDVLASRYQAAFLPHREIISRLEEGLAGNSLAAHFHGHPDMLCQGCHHNSPAGAAPPRCENCHGKPFNELNLFMPGLLGAYHQQCIGCHEAMEIPDSTGCTDCHEKKK